MKFKKRNIQVVDHSTGQTLDFPTFGKVVGEEAITELEKNVDNKIADLKSMVGTPLKASTASAMKDSGKIYVYTGSESGYTNGHWYYHDGSKWVDGGVYNSTAVETDKTLSVENMPADAKKTGDEINTLKNALSAFYKDDEVFENELSYVTATALPQTFVYIGLIPKGVSYKIEAVHTGGVSRIDIKLGTIQTYNTPNVDKKVIREEVADSDIYSIQVSIPADKVSANGTLTVVITVASPFDKKVDKSQGAENVGKILSVDNSGNVVLSDDMKYASLQISDNADDIKSVANEENPICIWRSVQSGGFDDDGNKIDSPLYCRQSYAIAYPYEKFQIRILKPGIKARVYFFTETTPSSSTYISKTDWNDADFVVDVPARSASRTNVYLFILIGRTDEANLSYEYASMSVMYLLLSSINRLPITRYTKSCAIHNGYVYYNANYNISDFITVSPGDVLKTVKVYAIGFYNAIGDYIQTILASSGSVTAPANSAYMLVQVKAGNIAYVGTEDEINNIYYISGERLENDDSDDVPGVYFENDYLPNKISKIRDNSNVEKGMSFAFVTDMHVNDNSLVSGKLLKYILNNSTIPFIVCGGDIPTAYATEYGSEASECESEAQRWIEYAQSFGWNRFFAVRGNHDFMKPSPQKSAQQIHYVAPEYKTYNYISRNNEHVIKRNPPHNYYYIDNISERIRIVVLDEYENGTYGTEQVLTQDQVDWILDDALNIDNYKVLFVSHAPFDAVWAHPDMTFAPIQSLMKAIKNKTIINYTDDVNIVADFTKTTIELIGHLCGHTHLDNYNVDDGVLTVTTTCDAFYKKYEHNRIEGTISEPAFDIISIDTENKIIKTCRIGEGSDRNILYDGENVYTITQNLTNCFSCFQTTEHSYGGSDWINFYHADSEYSIDNANVSITMGGTDVKSAVWNQNNKRIYIPEITGDVVITISAT